MGKWLLDLLGGVEPPEGAEPSLLRGTMFSKSDVGTGEWNTEVNNKLLKFTNDRRTIEWSPRNHRKDGMPIAWLPAMTRLRLHSGHYRWDFTIEEMGSAQIAVGIMLLFNFGPDWGFFGYLGSSSNAWAYDPSTGDVVTATRSIQGGLPRFEDGNTGVVTVDLDGVEARRVADVDDRTSVFWSPDGAHIGAGASILCLSGYLTFGYHT